VTLDNRKGSTTDTQWLVISPNLEPWHSPLVQVGLLSIAQLRHSALVQLCPQPKQLKFLICSNMVVAPLGEPTTWRRVLGFVDEYSFMY